VETLGVAPALRETGLRGGLVYWDGQLVDDARLVVALARSAAGFGARILTRLAVRDVAGPARPGLGGFEAISGFEVTVRDGIGGGEFTVRARAVVNATGVWAPTLAPAVRLRPSRGTHLVVRSEALAHGGALSVPMPGELDRFALVLPQGDGRVYVGLTDVPVDRVTDVPEPAEEEIAQLVDVVSTVLTAPLDRADVLGAFAGLRPLLDSGGDGRGAA
ncbi:FAD-dependent oxidoreductase, partial [Frankia sp. AgKG'84/4]|uniref:FAD-dependent oxidoreductase n=1 Tax=Frankia sp. AgKG'84/4 TaxID=573490 RepID=UPI002029E371